nr:unnamed protein product [Spirometra erinaceieuropaei]
MAFANIRRVNHCRLHRLDTTEEYSCDDLTIGTYFNVQHSTDLERNSQTMRVIHFADVNVNISGRMHIGSASQSCVIDRLLFTIETEQNIADIYLPLVYIPVDLLRKTFKMNLEYLQEIMRTVC